ncbi:enolase C-terminal domain-like protein [Pseudolysinimonas kribbensis]|uniref:Mandelate racemase n=1 Tax=Pseudolysinimonas kribbensis TaxID=433641 RepID=A0ABQ6K2L0_9MICO|nr:enolase C-terminal domain-like protein [Pseudolysinimonas kribbensis]GMA94544.1 mandelate racemase [Pseudolysinimonas kribbensis]
MTVSVLTRVFRVPTERPEADGTFAWDSTTVVVVQCESEGMVGTGWTYGAAAAGALIEEVLAPVLDDPDPVAAAEAMGRALRNVGRPGVGATALSAVDLALWDLAARRDGIPLVAALGGPVRDAVPVYGSGGFTTFDESELDAQLDDWMARGMRAVKIKIGQDRGTRVERDLARVDQVVARVGDRAAVFVDANGGYDVDQAIEVAGALAARGVAWFEEPVSSDDPAGLARVRAATPIDVAAGEYVWRRCDAEALLDAGAVDCLQLDVTRCGGPTAWRELAAFAADAGVDVSAHCAPQLSVHVGAVTPGLRHLEWFSDHERVEAALFDGTLPVRDGAVRPGDAPGHGMTLSTRGSRFRVA